MVAAGVGVTLLPTLAAEGRRDVELVPLTPEPSRRVALVWRKVYPGRDSVQALVEHLQAHVPAAVRAVAR